MLENERKVQESQKVWIEGDTIITELSKENGVRPKQVLPLLSLPGKYIDWIDQGRKGMYDKILGKSESVRFFAQHLPVIVTYSESNIFPFNCSNKGIGFIPKKEYLSEFIDLFQETLHNTRGKPWQKSIEERVNAISKFYFDHEKIDHRAMTSLEIFEKNTYQNLSQTPLASLLFTGDAPDYISFQLNCAVEVIGQDDPRHTFIMLARTMFEYDSFHIAQPQFPYAYIFWISEITDKSPYRVQKQNDKVQYIKTKGDLHWQADAIESISRAPGMIRQFIKEKIEDYARERGFTEIDLQLVREAKNTLEGKSENREQNVENTEQQAISEYKRIYVAVDNSELSNEAANLSIKIASENGGELTGSHVYAAKLHDKRFKAMESGLPEEYQQENELEKQRKIHDSLITKGLELITDSYLETISHLCRENNIPFSGKSLEGRNWQELVKDIAHHDYDLIALGAHGIGRVSPSILGSVTERVLRRVKRDIFLCKKTKEENQSDQIVVCLDGSSRSWGALKRGIQLSKAFKKKLIAISAFDPYFHYTMFNSLNQVLSDKARKVFKFEEQEKLHENIIDSGLAKIYQSHLDIAKKIALDDGIEIECHLLDGKAFEKILDYINKTSPWLMLMGRIGIHSDEEMDIGANTENICRLANCNLLIVEIQFKPPSEYQAEETITWTKEAQAKISKIPPMAKGVAMKAIQNHCIAQGYTVVTTSVLNEAIKNLLPPEAIEKMGITLDDSQNPDEPYDKISLSFKCQACGHVHHGLRPETCPICAKEGNAFKIIESKSVSEGITMDALGDRQLTWEKDALSAWNDLEDKILRQQIKTKLEKRAFTQRLSNITLEMFVECTKEDQDTPNDTIEQELIWTDDAIKRLERAPQGFMRQASKETIEDYAKDNYIKEITLNVAENGLMKARDKMMSAMQGRMDKSKPKPAHQEHKSGSFECHMCGYVVDGNIPDQCPACQSGEMGKLSAEERDNSSKASTLILEWDKNALKRLEKIPAGFMRTMTRCRIEHWARQHSHCQVTIDVIEAKYASWAEGSSNLQSEFNWTKDAQTRVNRIPRFIRAMVIKEIECKAKALGKVHIDAKVLESVYANWNKNLDSFHK